MLDVCEERGTAGAIMAILVPWVESTGNSLSRASIMLEQEQDRNESAVGGSNSNGSVKPARLRAEHPTL